MNTSGKNGIKFYRTFEIQIDLLIQARGFDLVKK